MKNKKLALAICIASLGLTGMNAFAAAGQSVSATISSNQTSAESTNAIWNCQGALELDGSNKKNSTNSLYVQCYEQRNKTVDRKETEFLISKGNSDSQRWTLNSYNSGRSYYVKLNPKGALKKGCNGSGTLYD